MKKDSFLTKSGSKDGPLGEVLRSNGVSRRSFMKFCATTASMMALPPAMIPMIARALEQARRPSVIWLSFQECTGCTESLTRAHTSSLESLIFDAISLDYHHTLQAASGHAAEEAREMAMEENYGEYLLVVDGSIPLGNPGYSTIAGISNYDMLVEAAKGAAAIIAVGTCSTYGGIPHANPNPTGAVSVSDIITDKPIVNVPGCPPIPVVITGVLAHFLTFGALPELDHIGRPTAFYGNSIHDRCYRRPFYDKGNCLSWVVRAQPPITPVQPPSGMTVPAFPLRRVIHAWAVLNRTSGMAAASIGPCPCRRRTLPEPQPIRPLVRQ